MAGQTLQIAKREPGGGIRILELIKFGGDLAPSLIALITALVQRFEGKSDAQIAQEGFDADARVREWAKRA